MSPVSLILLALTAGFLAGHGFELAVDLIPLVALILIGFLAIKAVEFVSEGD